MASADGADSLRLKAVLELGKKGTQQFGYSISYLVRLTMHSGHVKINDGISGAARPRGFPRRCPVSGSHN